MKNRHPGQILSEKYLKPLGISPNALAIALSVSPTRVTDIIREKRGITADTALRLAKFFGNSPDFWIRLQNAYDLCMAREALEHDADTIQDLAWALRRMGAKAATFASYLGESFGGCYLSSEPTPEAEFDNGHVCIDGVVGENLADRGLFTATCKELEKRYGDIRPFAFTCNVGYHKNMALFANLVVRHNKEMDEWGNPKGVCNFTYHYNSTARALYTDPKEWLKAMKWFEEI